MPGDHQQPAPGQGRRTLLSADPSTESVWRGRYRPLSLGIVALITLSAFEAIGAATAMPVVALDLGILSAYTWAFTGFIAASLVAMVAGGLWSDARGPREPLITGTIAFAVGAIVAGSANGLDLLILGRALQGGGSGLLIVAVYVLIARAYPERLRPRAFSVLAAAWVIPALAGPFIAGWLAETVTWRAVFWLVPVLVIGPVILLFPRIGAYEGGTLAPRALRRLVAGAVSTAALLVLQDGLLRVSVAGIVESAVAFLVLLVSLRPLLPVGALRLARGLPASVMMRGLVASAFYSAEVFVPLALVRTRGLSATQAGAVLSVSVALWALGAQVQGRVDPQRDRSNLVRLGAAMLTGAILVLPVVVLTSLPVWVVGLAWAVGAIGMGIAVPSVSVQVTRLSPRDALGANSAAIQIIDAVMGAVVVSVLSLGHAWAEEHGGATAGTYALLWLGAAVTGAATIVLAGRMRPVGEPEPASVAQR